MLLRLRMVLHSLFTVECPKQRATNLTLDFNKLLLPGGFFLQTYLLHELHEINPPDFRDFALSLFAGVLLACFAGCGVATWVFLPPTQQNVQYKFTSLHNLRLLLLAEAITTHLSSGLMVWQP
jgi:hypothetical protein